MRFRHTLLLAFLVSACAAPQTTDPSMSSPPVPSATVAEASVAAVTPRPSVDGHPLSELLPTSVAGVATRLSDFNPTSRSSPRVFLKVVARLAEAPGDGEVALSYTPDSTVYGVRIKGASGEDIMGAFLAERQFPDGVSLPTESIGGKQAARLAKGGHIFAYVNDDVFYYLESKDDEGAAEMLQQLP